MDKKMDSKNKFSEYLAEAFLEREQEEDWKRMTELFSRNKHKNFIRARSIILDFHLQFDFFLSLAVAWLCILGAYSIKLPLIKSKELPEALSNVEFGKRIKIVSKLGIFSSAALKTINNVNDLRNAFAHKRKENANVFNYDGKSIFELDGINGVFRDFDKVKDEFLNFTDKC